MIEAPDPGDPAGGGPAGGVPTGGGGGVPTGGGGSRAVERSAARARRPAIVTILALLQLLTAAAYGLVVLGLLVDGSTTMVLLISDAASPGSPATTVQVATAMVIVGGFGVAALAAGILLLRMNQLGWTITMLLTGLGLVSSISIWWTQGTTIPIWLFVQVVTVFYLNQRQVREAFGIARREAGDAPGDAGTTRDAGSAALDEVRG